MTDYIIANDGSAEDEAVLGATDIFDNIASAERHFEHWISEEPAVRFYDARGERLIAVDDGDMRFHIERTGTFFEGFEDLVMREAVRSGLDPEAEGLSVDDVLRALWARDVNFQKENGGCLGWLLPSPLWKLLGGLGKRNRS